MPHEERDPRLVAAAERQRDERRLREIAATVWHANLYELWERFKRAAFEVYEPEERRIYEPEAERISEWLEWQARGAEREPARTAALHNSLGSVAKLVERVESFGEGHVLSREDLIELFTLTEEARRVWLAPRVKADPSAMARR